MKTAEKLAKMTLEEFKAKYMMGDKVFDFKKFSITCNECGSKNVEFGGVCQEDSSSCYYPEDTPNFKTFFVCKCQECGNGFALCKSGTDEYVSKTDWVEEMQEEAAKRKEDEKKAKEDEEDKQLEDFLNGMKQEDETMKE